MHERYEAALDAVAYLQTTIPDVIVYSAIVHWHPVAAKHRLPRDVSYWKTLNAEMIVWATKLRVLLIEGWKSSIGVQDEIKQAQYLLKPVEGLLWKCVDDWASGLR